MEDGTGIGQMVKDRRRDRRLGLRFPVQCWHTERGKGGGRLIARSVTSNISTSGVRFESNSDQITPGVQLRLVFTVPPDMGYLSHGSELTAIAKVLRVQDSDQNGAATQAAARFVEPLSFDSRS